MQNPFQLFLSILAAREESIFMVRIFGNQLHFEDNKTKYVRDIQEEVMRGEYKREHLENQLLNSLTEQHRKMFLPKIVQKHHKITTYFLNKTQIYFPKQGQMLCQEAITQPNLRNILQGINNESVQYIMRYISNQQRYKLKHELNKMGQYEKEDRCNRNEKFFSENQVLGLQGIKYLNEIHRKYCYTANRHSNRNVYDVLLIDDQSKSLYLQGAGFRSLFGQMSKIKEKQNDQQQSVYVPVESTQEIITQRFDKLMKELGDQNNHVQKSIRKYVEQYAKYQKKQPIRRSSFKRGQAQSSPKQQIQLKITTHKFPIQDSKSQQIFPKKMTIPLRDNHAQQGLLTEFGRYSEPIYKQSELLESLNTVRSNRRKLPIKCKTLKQEDQSNIIQQISSPTSMIQSVPVNIRINKSMKLFDLTLLKPTIFEPSRVGSSRRSRHYQIH